MTTSCGRKLSGSAAVRSRFRISWMPFAIVTVISSFAGFLWLRMFRAELGGPMKNVSRPSARVSPWMRRLNRAWRMGR